MINRDPKCVYVADDFGMAGFIVSWLGTNDIEAVIMDEATLGGLEGLTAFAPGRVSTRGLEVWVVDPARAETAKTLLASQEAEIQARRAAKSNRTGTVSVVCEDCSKETKFPLSMAGRTENCPHCQAYLDVPDPDAEPEDEYWKTPEADPENA